MSRNIKKKHYARKHIKYMNIFVCMGWAVIFCLFSSQKWFTTVLKSRKKDVQLVMFCRGNIQEQKQLGVTASGSFLLLNVSRENQEKNSYAFQMRFFFLLPFVPVASLLNSQCPADFSSNGTYILKLAYPKSPSKPSIVEFYKQEAWETERFFQQNKFLYLHFSWSGKKERKQNPQVQAGFNSKWLVFYLNSIFISFLHCTERKMEVFSRHKDYQILSKKMFDSVYQNSQDQKEWISFKSSMHRGSGNICTSQGNHWKILEMCKSVDVELEFRKTESNGSAKACYLCMKNLKRTHLMKN